ncbi:hypothetical protein DPMN_146011 [Dreissena polymorpha]|uniref:Uncharacterized protein n=1 Tax=Dreissena polymorpha TaxID=45954 RepID=A0A9D4J1L2_DREPO|nr:hypothetical protein DPMN_146011 [Dreissena polymorpha]
MGYQDMTLRAEIFVGIQPCRIAMEETNTYPINKKQELSPQWYLRCCYSVQSLLSLFIAVNLEESKQKI